MIKKHLTNSYIKGGDVWVRDFTSTSTPIDISNLTSRDKNVLIENEMLNMTLNIMNISESELAAENVVIISDGYDFDARHRLLAELDKSVVVIAVNGALRKWRLYGAETENTRPISCYVINNPFDDSISYLPKKNGYFPTCIASTRTNHNFLKRYAGRKYIYTPTPQQNFGMRANARYFVDDYRNPICAAIGLAYRFGVKKLMLLCCDDSFATERAGSIQLENSLWTYPPQVKSQQIIDANLHWMTHDPEREVKVASYSSGVNYVNAQYITSYTNAIQFFSNEGQEE